MRGASSTEHSFTVFSAVHDVGTLENMHISCLYHISLTLLYCKILSCGLISVAGFEGSHWMIFIDIKL